MASEYSFPPTIEQAPICNHKLLCTLSWEERGTFRLRESARVFDHREGGLPTSKLKK